MGNHFVLSDFENVQFKEIGALKPGECRIKLFIGQSQTKLSVTKPAVTPAEANTKTRAAEVLRRLAVMSRPTKVATLQSSIKSFFKPALNDRQVASVVQSFADSRRIVIDGSKVTYPPAGHVTA